MEEVIGESVACVLHPDDLDMALERLGTLLDGQPTALTTVRLVCADGSIGHWEITSGLMRDPIAGGRVLTCRDVTDRLRREQEAATRVEYLRYAFDVAQSALDLDPADFLRSLPEVCDRIATMLAVDLVYVDQIDERGSLLSNLAGRAANGSVVKIQGSEALQLSMVPRWVERLRAPEPIVVSDSTTCEEPWAIEKRRVLGGGGGLISVGMSAAGELFGVLGVSMTSQPRTWTDDEVTFLRILAETIAHVLERARVDEALRTSEAKFRLLSETAADVVILLDAFGRIAYASPSSEDLLGYRPDALIGRRASELMDRDHRSEFWSIARTLRAGGSLTSEFRLRRADGSAVWVSNSISAVTDQCSGRSLEYRTSMRDISDRKRLEAELEWQALHDPLTGLGNRILLRGRMGTAVERVGASTEVAVLMFDLDGFKEINDSFGHAVGDDVLCIVADRLTQITRAGDTLARTGGDEFVLLCPNTPVEDALHIAERIVAAISVPITVGSITVEIGASVGVARGSNAQQDPDWMLVEADHAMYAAKRAGRGLVRVAGIAA